MASPSRRGSSGPGLTFTPKVTQLRGNATPTSRAKSAEPTSRWSVHTPASASRRTPRTPHQHLSTSKRTPNAAATPHGIAAHRERDRRRAAIHTSGKNRRRSGRDVRGSPRDWLRALSKAEASKTAKVTTSSSPADEQGGAGLGEDVDRDDDDDDDIPIDMPRLSLPIDAADEDSELYPHKSAGLEELEYTSHSVEIPRRALSEQPRRFSRGSLASIRMSDYLDVNALRDDLGANTTFFQQGVFDAAFEEPADEEPADATFERLDSEMDRRETLGAGRESGFGVIDVPLDANESTFFLQAPPPSSPERLPSEAADEAGDEAASDNERRTDGLLGQPSEVDEDPDVGTTRVAAAARKTRQKKRGVKLSKYGIEYPSLPAGVVKRLAQNFAQTSGVGKAKISPEALGAIMQASDWFFEQLGDDLQAYAKHAGRKVIDESDMLTLMRRQRQTSSSVTPFSLAQRHLPRELLQELRMPAPAPIKKRRSARPGNEDGS